MSEVIRVILPAWQIPCPARVTKYTSTIEYSLRDRFFVRGLDGEERVIPASQGARFLVDKNGDAHAIGSDAELVWLTDLDAINELFDEAD